MRPGPRCGTDVLGQYKTPGIGETIFQTPDQDPEASEGPPGHLYCISAVYGPILFKLCVQVAYRPALIICYMAFTIKGQIKAAADFKDSFGVY